MTRTLAQYVEWAGSHPKPHQGGTWNQRCEQLVNNAGDFPYSFDNAYLAALASGHLDPDHATAKNGEFHYWSSGGRAPGHVALQTDEGLLMASNAIVGFVGYLTWQAFATYKPGFKYMGHTFRHGPQTLAGLSTSSTGGQQVVDESKDHTVGRLLKKTPTGTLYEYDGIAFTLVPKEKTNTLLAAYNNETSDVNQAQLDSIEEFANTKRAALIADIISALPAPAGSTDTKAILAAIAKIPKAPSKGTISLS